MYYFAYGTLLDLDAMKGIAPSVRSHGVMRLDGYRLGFGRCARADSSGCTLDPTPGAVTYGIQYELSDEEMAGMDKVAVSGRDLWVHMPITVSNAAGERVESLTYVIPGKTRAVSPSDNYVRPILKGLDQWELPTAYVTDVKSIIAEAQAKE